MVDSTLSTVSMTLGVFYLVLTLLVSVQIAKIIYYGHNMFSFQSGFLMMCFVWSVLRAALFLVPTQPTLVGFFLEWVPTTLQFATFLLLAMFYAYLVERNDWETKRFYWQIGLVSAVASSVVVTILCCVLLPVLGQQAVRRLHIFFAGVIFLSLSIILLYYSYRLYDLGRYAALHPLSSMGVSRRKYQAASRMLWISSLLIICFLSRAFSDLAATVGWMDYGAFDGTRSVVGFHEHPIESTLMLLWWEIIPTFVLVGYFWHIPRASSTFYRLPYRAVGGLDRMRSQYGSVDVGKHSASLRKMTAPSPESFVNRQSTFDPVATYQTSSRGESENRHLDSAVHKAAVDKPAGEEGGRKAWSTSSTSQQRRPQQTTTEGTLPPAPQSQPPTLAQPPPSHVSLVSGIQNLLDNPSRYDTDDEGTTATRQ